MPKIVIQQYERTAQYFIQDLDDIIKLEMNLIPGGTFIMGSPEEEEVSYNNEHPQHPVMIKPFCLGRYQVTQAQWRIVAGFPQVKRELDSDPSGFKGANLPVERVSWYDVVEFCDRLSNHTNKPYRLPTEAEWEYACRAGTITPFHFGQTITTDLANYRGTDLEYEKSRWSGSYGAGPKGVYREKTTEVGSFGVANNFGLYDMHGNVWEWCQDDYINRYDGIPADGSAYINENSDQYRVLRGGSWIDYPVSCRCAARVRYAPDVRYYYIGFRVALGRAARVLH